MSDVYAPAFGNPVAPWHRWFAWRPVNTIDRGTRWLIPIWRRRCQKKFYLEGGADFWFQYAVDITPTPSSGKADQ
ncbi:hypothetical protein [Gordonia rubripertincta]|uniref:hypothetical protein n=1 Tax=Gordonia rubripertincta TaxID=36822 RepID=UPI0015F953E7|nr:hypothetical protein [Gordonia rubripertincta]QMU19319.1 hypothetical protein H3V45_14585 [Gordonia rubripertincta]